MKIAKEILDEKLKDDRNFCIAGKYTLMEYVLLEAMEEYAQQQVSVEPVVKVNFADTLETVIKYYNDLQTEAPDNLSLGRFHTNMIILIEKFEEYKSKISA